MVVTCKKQLCKRGWKEESRQEVLFTPEKEMQWPQGFITSVLLFAFVSCLNPSALLFIQMPEVLSLEQDFAGAFIAVCVFTSLQDLFPFPELPFPGAECVCTGDCRAGDCTSQGWGLQMELLCNQQGNNHEPSKYVSSNCQNLF